MPATFPLLIVGAGLIDYLLRMGRHWDGVEPAILLFYLLVLADLGLVVYRANRVGPVGAASLNVVALVLLAIGFVWCVFWLLVGGFLFLPSFAQGGPRGQMLRSQTSHLFLAGLLAGLNLVLLPVLAAARRRWFAG